jgi:hypothetical protein
MHSEFRFDLKVRKSSYQINSSCTVKRVHLSSLKAKPSPSNVISGNVVQTFSLGMELDTSLPRAEKSAVKQLPEPVKIQSTHTSFSRGKYEDFRIRFVWTYNIHVRAASIINFIFLGEPS